MAAALSAAFYIFSCAPAAAVVVESSSHRALIYREHLETGELLSQAPLGAGCGINTYVTERSERGRRCPASCPLYVHDKRDSKHCSFQCVPNTVQDCLLRNPNTSVPDLKLGACRACKVEGCKACVGDGTDTCATCKNGFVLSKGECNSTTFWIWYVVFGILGFFVIFILAWLISLTNRPIINEEGLERGHKSRSAAKIHMPPKPHHRHRKLYPYNTRLLTEPIAGIGVMHLFNFQFAVILWASSVFFAWVALGFVVDYDYFRVGVQPPGETPRENCIVVAWGYATQSRLMIGKVSFVAGVYIFSFVSAICYGIHRLRTHQRHLMMPQGRLSHKGYCARCEGLTRISGKERLEEKLKECVEKSTDKKVVGVSVLWDFYGQEDIFMEVLNEDIDRRMQMEDLNEHIDERIQGDSDANRSAALPESSPASFSHLPSWQLSTTRMSRPKEAKDAVNNWFYKWEKFLLQPSVQRIVKRQHGSTMMAQSSIRRVSNQIAVDAEALTADPTNDAVANLKKLYCTSEAFIVFNTLSDRDAAVQSMSGKEGVDFEFTGADGSTYSSKIRLHKADREPQGVQWNRVTERPLSSWAFRIILGVACICMALLLWLGVYFPYASSVLTSDYANGTDPSEFNRMMFGFIVIGGNALMYVVCSEVADRIGFKYQSQREMCYMLSYFFACVTNVVLDLTMVYMIAHKEQVGKGMTTYDGRRLGEVSSFNDIFETYAMQKSLGQMLLDYSFPATFLLPYMVEPFVVIIVPYLVMSMIVKRHRIIKGFAADAYLASTPMDLSRYADVMLNVMLAVLMFFFPGGYVLYVFGGLVLSHIIIFNYDRLRVLRSVPACNFSTRDVDLCAQWLLSVPCGLLLTCIMFKANCEDFTQASLCDSDHHIILKCAVLMCAHICVHSLILFFVVPMFGLDSSKFTNDEPYKYIYKDDPPCDFLFEGFDYLLRKNKDLHLYYKSKAPLNEEYDVIEQARSMARSVTAATINSVSKVSRASSSLSNEQPDEESGPDSSSSSSSSHSSAVRGGSQALPGSHKNRRSGSSIGDEEEEVLGKEV